MKTRLATLHEGDSGTITGFEGGDGVSRKMHSLGLADGKEVEVVSRHPLKGPVVIRIGHMVLALGRTMALKVIVDR